jgi:hypothetical protein
MKGYWMHSATMPRFGAVIRLTNLKKIKDSERLKEVTHKIQEEYEEQTFLPGSCGFFLAGKYLFMATGDDYFTAEALRKVSESKLNHNDDDDDIKVNDDLFAFLAKSSGSSKLLKIVSPFPWVERFKKGS